MTEQELEMILSAAKISNLYDINTRVPELVRQYRNMQLELEDYWYIKSYFLKNYPKITWSKVEGLKNDE